MAAGTLTLAVKGTKNLRMKGNGRPKLTKYKAVYRAKGHRTSDLNVNRFNLVKEHRMLRLHYKTGFNLFTSQSSAQSNWSTAFRMSSIFDPDYSNVAKNKLVEGFYQTAALYKKYKVYGFSAKVKFINVGSNPARVYIGAADSVTWSTDYSIGKLGSDIASREGVKSKVITSDTSSGATATLTYKCIPREVLGLNKTEWSGDPDNGALMGANPSAVAQPFFTVGIAGPVDVPYDLSVMCEVEITYLVRVEGAVDAPDS